MGRYRREGKEGDTKKKKKPKYGYYDEGPTWAMVEATALVERELGGSVVEWVKTEPPEEKELLPEGSYPAKVTAATVGETANKKLMLKFTFRVTEGPHVNTVLFGRLIYSPENPKAVWAFNKQLANMQVGEAFLSDGPEPEEVAEACLTARVVLDVAHEEYMGNRVASVGWIGEAPAKEG